MLETLLGLKNWLGPVPKTLLGLKTWLGPVLETLGVVHKLSWPILGLSPSPWLTALLNKDRDINLVMLTFHEPPLPPWL